MQFNKDLAGLLPTPKATDNKYSRGVVGFVTGSKLYPGAALLGVDAALKLGVGFVKYFGPKEVCNLVVLAHPEVVVTTTDEKTYDERVSTWVIGSGFDLNDSLQQEWAAGCLATTKPLIIDAGALQLVKANSGLHMQYLLTPHWGEALSLAKQLGMANAAAETDASRLELATELARCTAATVLLKGSTTLIVQPNGQTIQVGPSSPHLAVAGSGDVLAGILAALAALNNAQPTIDWLQIGQLAVTMHSRAAELASEYGPVSASQILAQLPTVALEVFQSA